MFNKYLIEYRYTNKDNKVMRGKFIECATNCEDAVKLFSYRYKNMYGYVIEIIKVSLLFTLK